MLLYLWTDSIATLHHNIEDYPNVTVAEDAVTLQPEYALRRKFDTAQFPELFYHRLETRLMKTGFQYLSKAARVILVVLLLAE